MKNSLVNVAMNEEIVCGFKVSTERKKVWRTQLEMVKLFQSVCKKYNLKYVASGGTLIGAIRHNGYIPWDDDIDIMMPRADYEIFLTVCQKELPCGYFLQCNKTEKYYPNGHAQIRNCETACFNYVSCYDMQYGKNCGIFIDIFPYDDVPDNVKKRRKMARKIRFLKKICTLKIYSDSPNLIKKLIKNFLANTYFLFHSLEKTIDKINIFSQKYNGKTQTVALVSFMPGYEKNIWDKKLFDKTVLHKFEDIEIAIPENYDGVLRHEFGDYMKIPEDLNSGSIHGKCYFDTEKSYKEFVDFNKDALYNLINTARL